MSFFLEDEDEEEQKENKNTILTVQQLKAKRQREIVEEFWSDPCWAQ